MDELKQNGLCGTPAEVIEKIEKWKSVGAERLYLQILDLADLDHVNLIGAEVIPHI